MDILFPITKKVLVCLSEALRVNKSLKHLYFYTNAGLEMIPTLRWKEFCKSLKGYYPNFTIKIHLSLTQHEKNDMNHHKNKFHSKIRVRFSRVRVLLPFETGYKSFDFSLGYVFA